MNSHVHGLRPSNVLRFPSNNEAINECYNSIFIALNSVIMQRLYHVVGRKIQQSYCIHMHVIVYHFFQKLHAH